jgi:hypothetical protein
VNEEENEEVPKEEPSEVEGMSGIESVIASSSSSYTSYSESAGENSTNQPAPLGDPNEVASRPMVPPGKMLMTADHARLQAAMTRLGINTEELGIYPYGG